MKFPLAVKFSLKKLNTLARGFLIALWTVGIAFVATLLFAPFISLEGSSPFFLIAVMISAWRGGLKSGFFATALSAAANIFIFFPPVFSLAIVRKDISEILIDVCASIVIGTLSAARRKAENEREALLIGEKAARIEAERANKVKDEFLAAVSHELRTPLTTIKTLTRILLRKKTTAAERREYLSDIASECDRQIELVHNLLHFSGIQAGAVKNAQQPLSIGDVVRACEKAKRPLVAERNQQLQVEITPDLPRISGDYTALRRALRAIVENAIKYTPDKGLIVIKAFRESDSEVAIEVTDNGRGIHPNDLPHIFENFFRGHLLGQNGKFSYSDEQEVPGIGLGLHLAKILIEEMKGFITVESEVGRGSTFKVVLPIWVEAPEKVADNSPIQKVLFERV